MMRTRASTTSLFFLLVMLCTHPVAAMTLTSDDLSPGKSIPAAHIYPRCGGRNLSPQLTWSGVPKAAKSLVLTMIDLDVKPSQWSHWILIDLPPNIASLAQGTSSLPGGTKPILSNFGEAAYAGPCPPKGSGLHHYEFTIWALPMASASIAPDEKATDVVAYLAQRALARASLVAFVQAPPT